MDKKTVITFLYAPVLLLLVCIPDCSIHKTEQMEKKEVTIYAKQTPTTSPSTNPTSIITSKPTSKPTKSPTKKPTETPTKPTYIYLDIPLSKELQEYTFKQCNRDKDLYFLVMAIMQAESGFDSSSVGPDGKDLGIMQIRTCNLASMEEKFGSIDLMNPYDNIKCGVSMIKGLYKKYEYKNLALMAYNCGEAGARKLWKKGIYSTEYSRKVTEYYDSFEEKE